MFHAVRNWWSVGRGKATTRLFVFEFLVVMAGVLAAQWLQQRQQLIAAREDARRLLADSEASHVSMISRSFHWHKYGPCIIARADAVARAAGEGRTMTKAEIGRPGLPSVGSVNWTRALLGAAADLVGPEKMADYQDLEANAQILDAISDRVSNDWAIFSPLDPRYGKPSAQDLANVRLAAVRVANNVRLLQFKYSEDEAPARRLGLKPSPVAVGVIDGCGMLRSWR